PPLRGEDRRGRPLPTGVATIDAMLFGGFPRGQLSEVHGPASSGRTGLLLALLARSTGGGALAPFAEPRARLAPAAAPAPGAGPRRATLVGCLRPRPPALRRPRPGDGGPPRPAPRRPPAPDLCLKALPRESHVRRPPLPPVPPFTERAPRAGP